MLISLYAGIQASKNLSNSGSKAVKESTKPDKVPRLPYTASENSLEMYAAMQKYQRSNSCGDNCEEAIYSPSNTVAEIFTDTCNAQIHVKDVWSNSTTSSPDLEIRSQKKRFLKSFTIEKRDILAFRHG